MPKGYLKIQLTTALDAKPVRDAMIRIYQNINEEIINESFYMSDAMGVTPYIPLDAPEEDLSLDEINNSIKLINDKIDEDANVIFGTVIDPALDDEVEVTVIATGIEDKKMDK